MQIRTATSSDIPFIVEAQLAMAMETESLRLDRGTVFQGVSHVIHHPEVGFYWLAEESETPVASVLILKEWSDWRNGSVLWIHSLYVLPDFRRKGVFKQFYSALQDKVQQDDRLRGLRLYVERANYTAQMAYRSVGMTDEHYSLFEWMKTF